MLAEDEGLTATGPGVSARNNGDDGDIEVRFWGVRGSIPCPGPDTVVYGGNTPCLEVRVGDAILVFDAGTGIRELGNALNAQAPVAVEVFFTHTTFERISGIPFFTAAYNPANRCRFWAGGPSRSGGIYATLTGLMVDPVFPVPIDVMGATLDFADFQPGDTLEPAPGVRLRTATLNDGMTVIGYRVEAGTSRLAYVSDLIAGPGGDRAAALDLLAGADIAIVNTADHAPGRADWRNAARLCIDAGVGTCVLFHHLPECDDAALDARAHEAERLCPGTIVAREGLVLTA